MTWTYYFHNLNFFETFPKTRTCSNPTPYNYKTCEGVSTETSSCTGGQCNPPTAGSGEVTSPNYPDNYPNNAATTTPIEVSAGSRIELEFVDFAIEDESTCAYDYVQGQQTQSYYS